MCTIYMYIHVHVHVYGDIHVCILYMYMCIMIFELFYSIVFCSTLLLQCGLVFGFTLSLSVSSWSSFNPAHPLTFSSHNHWHCSIFNRLNSLSSHIPIRAKMLISLHMQWLVETQDTMVSCIILLWFGGW